ncbi:amidohydrolase [Parafrankia sp. EUN1f]|nr:amidohydrolase [Parafrankia sp. EUN1f]
MVALRADIDALPIQDEKDVPYRSKVSGVSHSCGHDVHTAIVLGAGLELAQRQAEFATGGVRLIFQAAEEVHPSGALAAIDAGVLDQVGMIYALHCDPKLTAGTIGTRSGPITASSDYLEITVQALESNAPENDGRLTFALAKVLSELPTYLQREFGSTGFSVPSLVFGRVDTELAVDGQTPVSEYALGTVRCLDRDSWERAPAVIDEYLAKASPLLGAQVTGKYTRVAPSIINDPECTQLLEAAVTAELGAANLVHVEQSLGGEDFSWFLEKVPGSYARLGVSPRDAPPSADLHSGRFDVDESAIDTGVRVLTETALMSLRAAKTMTASRATQAGNATEAPSNQL